MEAVAGTWSTKLEPATSDIRHLHALVPSRKKLARVDIPEFNDEDPQ